MHELLCRLPASEIEKAPGAWVGEFASAQASPQIVLDGKTLRASAGSEYPALHLLAAYCPQVGGVLAQLPADGKDNEITAAKAMLKALPVKGAVVTGDAMFCQRELCAAISSKDGDFLFVVKDNQPALVQDIEAAFSPPFSPKERLEREKSLSRHETVEKKHGRLEYRSLEATPILCGYLDKWPHVKQVFRLVRRRGTNEEMVAAQTPIVLHVPNDRFYCIV